MGKVVRYIDEYEKTQLSECKHCKGECRFDGMRGIWHCEGFAPMTNFDRVTSSAERLADFLDSITDPYYIPSSNGWIDWLKQEVDT